ncbi:hypothetical protein HYH03_000289 [Edaphochlamys debaryana]|uniref:DNA excision repair protein ERCC-8 n=1 Tax=Edaphochlamys debaryana TaxID=47281 RepID=A0A836C798_9CHLO|nr:hypothetical protein HYH03_000289 [Edaphochlamys debaryana]|eukprot:KAG2501789.1 hypothetical protein HYH03_000289 [Edaphochlamys debaryana]
MFRHYEPALPRGQRPVRHLRQWGKRSKNDVPGLQLREEGWEPVGFRSCLYVRSMEQLRTSETRLFASPFTGGVVCMDLDKTEDRFLLAGSADTSLALFDTHTGSETGVATMKPVFTVKRQSIPSAHKFMVSTVAWYPVDTGLFVTGSHDCEVKVWDTNALEVVTSFRLPKKVASVAMSPLAACHSLVAAGCEDTDVRLCDFTSGAVSHVFSGHRDSVWTVAWSSHSEYELLSGDGSGQVRVWDVRRAGCRAVLDQYATQRTAPPSAEEPPPFAAPAKKFRRGGSGSGSMSGSSSAPALLGAEAATAARMKESALRAHTGAVTCVLPCPDGISLLTAGTDGRMRLWDAQYRVNKLVGYEGTHNRALRARQLAVTEDARVVFYPSGSSVNVYEVQTGRMLAALQGAHTESINACVYNPTLRELYTGSNDKTMRVHGLCEPREEAEDEDAEAESCNRGAMGAYG